MFVSLSQSNQIRCFSDVIYLLNASIILDDSELSKVAFFSLVVSKSIIRKQICLISQSSKPYSNELYAFKNIYLLMNIQDKN